MMDMRELSGRITEHVYTTKDKYGEVSLNLLLLNEVLDKNQENLQKAPPKKREKFHAYITAKLYKTLLLLHKLHEDTIADFADTLENLGTVINKNSALQQVLVSHGFEIRWLLEADLPDNLNEVYKSYRSNLR